MAIQLAESDPHDGAGQRQRIIQKIKTARRRIAVKPAPVSIQVDNTMKFQYPHVIDNGHGEKLTFLRLVEDPAGDWLEVENYVLPNAGPPMHMHHRQSECLNVVSGKLGTQVLGEEPKYLGPGETAIFEPGVVHRFWNAGTEPLVCKGWIKPADNIVYFLSSIYQSIAASGTGKPDTFDVAWLLKHYRSEFEMTGIPVFVQKVIFPMALFFGKLSGKHRKFEHAPAPVK